MTKREEAARALCEIYGEDPESEYSPDPYDEQAVQKAWKYYLPQVDAVIACIREPDEKMLAAGVAEHVDQWKDDRLPDDVDLVVSVYQATLDAME